MRDSESPIVGYAAGVPHSGPVHAGLFISEDYMGGATVLRRGFERATVYPTADGAQRGFWHWATTQPDWELLECRVFTLRKK